MTRLRTYITAFVSLGMLAACGKPLETKEEFQAAAANAAVPATAARTTGALLNLYASHQQLPEELPEPSISVRGTEGGEAILSVNPIGLAVGLAGQGILFDTEYKGYSVDGINFLTGKVSVLANFDYAAAINEDPNADFKVSFVGDLGISGIVRDETRISLVIKTNVNDLMTREGVTKLRLNGKVTASEQEFVFEEEDVEIDWNALAAAASQTKR